MAVCVKVMNIFSQCVFSSDAFPHIVADYINHFGHDNIKWNLASSRIWRSSNSYSLF